MGAYSQTWRHQGLANHNRNTDRFCREPGLDELRRSELMVWTPEALWVLSAPSVAAAITSFFWLIDRIGQRRSIERLARNICDNEGVEGLEYLVPLVKAMRPKKKRLSLPRHGP
jgi:hypothetical protein